MLVINNLNLILDFYFDIVSSLTGLMLSSILIFTFIFFLLKQIILFFRRVLKGF